VTKRTAVVVGSGPNGLSAAIVLAHAGFDVEVREAQALPGGGVRSAELTLPGFVHDICSAVHPLALSSPFFSKLPLEDYGLEWIWSPAELAHPLDDGTAVLLYRDVAKTAEQFGSDAEAWRRMFEPLARNWKPLAASVLSPLRVPRHPFLLARFGVQALQPVTMLARDWFRGQRARALFAGVGGHALMPLDKILSGAFGLMLTAAGHAVGWPIPRGGSQNITNALIRVLQSLGGRVKTSSRVSRLSELSGADLVMLDITPRQVLELGAGSMPPAFRHALQDYRYGPGVFKVDWALREPIPWKAKECAQAITVHLGGSMYEIAASERDAWYGRPPEKPFVLLAQQSLFDSTRAPAGKQTAWAYCHVPNGWTGSALTQIEDQVERFAPGFRECILERSVHNPREMQRLNENLVGGDLNGGAFTLKQLALRPTWREYGTPSKGVYLCSASTLPGGGVHGMCGYNAAQFALARV
jgi:phytoene dehydrogenase-like protein